MYKRILDISDIVNRKSAFLLGPRQTGKSTYLAQNYPSAKCYNLLESDTFRELAIAPELIRQSLKPEEKLNVVDEIQKLPVLLDEVHLLIVQDKSRRFILTASSARKLRRGRVNLLAGRVSFVYFHPLVSPETQTQGGGEAKVLFF